MKMNIYRKIIPFVAVAITCLGVMAQVDNAGGVRKRSAKDRKTQQEGQGPSVSERMQGFYEGKEAHDADVSYMRQIYRQLDLTKDANTPLYFPEDVVDGQENLFRIMLKLVVDGKIPAYEYLDGREVFSDQYKINVPEMLDRFEIYYQPSGSGKNQKYVIEEADVPTGRVLNYYILEKWEFDRRTNRMKTRVEAICPVLNRSSDFGGDARYPMFWVKFDALRPYLAQQYIFLDDDNNLPQYSLDDYFNLGMYEGEIYKTKNLRNLSMMQLYPDPDDLKRAQDSIDNRLKNYAKDLWVPTREEFLAQQELDEQRALALAAGDTIPERTVVDAVADAQKTPTIKSSNRTSSKKRTKTKVKKAPSSPSSGEANSNATKSVRRRKR